MAFPTVFHQLEVVEEVRLMGASQEEGAAPNPAVASHPRPSQPFPVLSHKSCAVPICPAGRETPRSPTHLMGVTSNAGTALAGSQAGLWSQNPRQIRVSFRGRAGKAAGSAGRLRIIFLPSPGSVPAALLV